jgi:Skp family chaperone for outer membrane proteins
MKKLVLSGIVSLLVSGSALAQAQAKIGTVDLKKIFDGYYKTSQAQMNLREEASDKEKAFKQMGEDFNKSKDDWQKLNDKANDQAVSVEEREKSKQAGEKKFLELREKEAGLEEFRRSATAQLQEKTRRMRDKVVTEIREVLNARAKSAGYTLVLDTSGESGNNNTPLAIYTSGENDLTETVLNQLNATAPAAPKVEEKKEKGK